MESVTPSELSEYFQELIVEIRKLNTHVELQETPDRPLTRNQAAEYLSIHPDTLYRLAKTNKIAYSRCGEGKRAMLMFLKADLDDYIQRHRIASID